MVNRTVLAEESQNKRLISVISKNQLPLVLVEEWSKTNQIFQAHESILFHYQNHEYLLHLDQNQEKDQAIKV